MSVRLNLLKVDVFPPERENRKPGDAMLQMDNEQDGHLFVVLPGGDDVDCIPVTRNRQKAEANKRLWHLTGPVGSITLHPSVNAQGR